MTTPKTADQINLPQVGKVELRPAKPINFRSIDLKAGEEVSWIAQSLTIEISVTGIDVSRCDKLIINGIAFKKL